MVKQTAGHEQLGDFAEKFAELNDDILFGEVWSREDKLSLRDRSLVTICVFMGKGLVDSSLKYHIANAKKNGITLSEMAEIVTHAAFYAGWPNAWAVFNMVKEIYTDEIQKNNTEGGGQVLICVEGKGWYQEEGKEPRNLEEGDIVVIPANVKHWHGAKKDSWFSHIAVEIPGENTSNEWCEPVLDEEYDKLG